GDPEVTDDPVANGAPGCEKLPCAEDQRDAGRAGMEDGGRTHRFAPVGIVDEQIVGGGSAGRRALRRNARPPARNAPQVSRTVRTTIAAQRGSTDSPIRNSSIARAHWRPSRIAQTTSD